MPIKSFDQIPKQPPGQIATVQSPTTRDPRPGEQDGVDDHKL